MRFFIRSLTRLGGFTRRGGFTLIELLTVMAIIAVLAGLVLSISGFANKKAATARAQVEIQMLCTGCESYKADNGTYPRQPLATTSGSIPAISGTNVPSDQSAVSPTSQGNSTPGSSTSPTAYANASLELYEALSGDVTCTGTGGGPGVRNYIAGIKQDTLGRNNMNAVVSGTGSPPNTVFFLSDPFGNSYGYSTAYATALTSGSTMTTGTLPGYNPTYDLWCTGGQIANPNPPSTSGSAGDPMLQWVRNW